MTAITRTAGMVRGTPDWQLDRMYETDTERRLEEAYKEDDFPAGEVTLQIGYAVDHIYKAISRLCNAYDKADEYGRGGKLDDLITRLEDFRCDVDAEKRRLEGKQ